MSKTFADILNRPAQDIEKPKPRPRGAYIAVIQGMPKQKEVGADQTPVISYLFKLLSPQQLDDPSTDVSNIQDWGPMSKDFWINNDAAEYTHRSFLENTLGISAEGGKTTGQMVAESPGKQALVTLKHEPYTDANNQAQIATKIDKVAKV
jgi:hypothetical protein